MRWVGLFLFLLASLSFAAPLQYLTETNVTKLPFESLSSSATTWNAGDDTTSNSINIGFTFRFDNTNYTSLYINANGALVFGSGKPGDGHYSNEELEYNGNRFNHSIYPYWDDLDRTAVSDATIQYEKLGSGDSERFVVYWHKVPHWNGPGKDYTFQVILYKNGSIRFKHTDDADGTSYNGSDAGATIGVQEDRSHFHNYAYNSSSAIPSVDVLYSPTSISGHVYEDPNGDSQMGDQIAKSGVTVNLYRDSATGSVYQTTTTDSNGYYTFKNVPVNQVYWVAVDSETVTPDQLFNGSSSQDNIWAEQTYGAVGAQCADGSGGITTRSSAGSCFGGKDGAVSDDASAYNTSEHLIRVDTNGVSNNPDKDFGFSFNVVTSIRDGDDDTDNNRTIQGSLRQFTQNANALSGANTMRFVPSVAKNETSWWKIILSSALPSIDDDDTTVDGTAYSLSDGTTIDNSNTGTSGNSGGQVGVHQHTLPDYENKELEIDAGGAGNVFVINGNRFSIFDLSIFNGGTGIDIRSGGDNAVVQRLFLGTRADGSNPTNKLSRAVWSLSNSDNVHVLDNFVAYCPSTAVYTSGTGEIRRNHLLDNANGGTPDAITLEGNTNIRSFDVIDNYVDGAGGFGIESWQAGGGFTIENNTVLNTGSVGTSELGGIRIFGTGSTIRYNIVHDTRNAGIVIDGGSGSINIISRNSLYHNGGLGIDLDQTTSGNPDGDGVTPNDGALDSGKRNHAMNYPLITSATYDGSTLHIEGYVGSAAGQSAFGNAELEVYIADDDGNNDGEVIAGDGNSTAHGEGKTFFFSCSADGSGNFSCDYSSGSVDTSVLLTMTATLNSEGTSEFSANYPIIALPEMHVSKTSCVINDPVNNGTNPKRIPGATIRYAIEVSNTGLGAAGNVIVDDNISSYFDSLSITNLQIQSGVCDCSGVSSASNNGANGSTNGVNPVRLDYGTVSVGVTECGYFEVNIE